MKYCCVPGCSVDIHFQKAESLKLKWRKEIKWSVVFTFKKTLFNNFLQSVDNITADRRLLVQDLLANQDVLVYTPTMLSGRSQLKPNELAKNRKVACKRFHIEILIGLAKSNKILKKKNVPK